MKVLWNEEIVDESEVKIDIEDRGYQFGDGIYEVIRIYDGYMYMDCLLYTSPSPRDRSLSRMPSSA